MLWILGNFALLRSEMGWKSAVSFWVNNFFVNSFKHVKETTLRTGTNLILPLVVVETELENMLNNSGCPWVNVMLLKSTGCVLMGWLWALLVLVCLLIFSSTSAFCYFIVVYPQDSNVHHFKDDFLFLSSSVLTSFEHTHILTCIEVYKC